MYTHHEQSVLNIDASVPLFVFHCQNTTGIAHIYSDLQIAADRAVTRIIEELNSDIEHKIVFSLA
jgi:hypothetical protein